MTELTVATYPVLLDLPQDDAKKRKQQEDEEEAFAAFLLWLLMRLEAGEITEDEFTLLAGDGIKLYHWAAAVTGKGSTQLDGQDWAALGFAVAGQMYYLRNFGDVLAGLRAAGEAFTDGVKARLSMYANAVRATFFKTWAKTKGDQPMVWTTHPAEHCETCLEREGQIYPANALPWWPASGDTICRTNCKCSWEPVPTDEWGNYEEV